MGKNLENIVAYLKLLCRDSSGHKEETATKNKIWIYDNETEIQTGSLHQLYIRVYAGWDLLLESLSDKRRYLGRDMKPE